MLKISTRSRYGMLAMVELGKQYRKEPLSVAVINRKQKIPKFYLEQLLLKLRRAGLIESIRGIKGGFALRRAPEQIRILDIIKAVEGPVSLVDCTGEKKDICCQKIEKCLTRPFWVELHQAVEKVLAGKTLRELMR